MNRPQSPATEQTYKIFISYRRQLDTPFAGRLGDALSQHFPNMVFIDTEGIGLGNDWRKVIDKTLDSCVVMLVVISQTWASLKGTNRVPRLADTKDVVRYEIAAAIKRGMLVVPVLEEDTRMPKAEVLPKPIKGLLSQQGINLRNDHWKAGIDQLTKLIDPKLRRPQKFHPIVELKKDMVVLALGAHADDIELGCGATLLYLQKYYRATIHYHVFCWQTKIGKKGEKKIDRDKEMDASSRLLGVEIGNNKYYDKEDRYFPDDWLKIQKKIGDLRDTLTPHLIFAPSLQDNHQDHVVVAQGAIREFRSGEALWHYEVKQYGQDRFDPNIFINVSMAAAREDDKDYDKFYKKYGGKDTLAHYKVYILRKCMRSMVNRSYLDPALLLGIMRFRGMQCSGHVTYAEAFEGRMLIDGGQ